MRCGGVLVHSGACLRSCRSCRCWWGGSGLDLLPVMISGAGLILCGSPVLRWGLVSVLYNVGVGLLPVSGGRLRGSPAVVDLLGVGGAVAGLRSRSWISSEGLRLLYPRRGLCSRFRGGSASGRGSDILAGSPSVLLLYSRVGGSLSLCGFSSALWCFLPVRSGMISGGTVCGCRGAVWGCVGSILAGLICSDFVNQSVVYCV